MTDKIASSSVTPEEMQLIQEWMRRLTGSNAGNDGVSATGNGRHSEGVPFSFTCGRGPAVSG